MFSSAVQNHGPQDRHPTYAYGLRRLDRILAAINSKLGQRRVPHGGFTIRSLSAEKMNECTQLASNIIRWTHASDFELIQDEWEEQAESLSPTIEVLTNITQSTKAHQNNITPLRQHVIKLAKSSALLIKLSQMFLTKISKTKPKKLLFTLDTSIDSETLDDLHDRPGTIAYRLSATRELCPTVMSMTYWLGQSSDTRTNRGSLIHVRHHFGLPSCLSSRFTPGINYASLDTNFKAWLLEWQKSWHTATGHFNDVLDSSPDPN
ncbi:hypothetical protein H4Q26_008614 [Puccinia striiformis f. sp. tritici PST-130]|nr:hypothetical protein H4Q26_008614 [Puccinia striiformis f. sp. tritici PST-130]